MIWEEFLVVKHLTGRLENKSMEKLANCAKQQIHDERIRERSHLLSLRDQKFIHFYQDIIPMPLTFLSNIWRYASIYVVYLSLFSCGQRVDDGVCRTTSVLSQAARFR